MDGHGQIICGDCIQVMRGMPEHSVDMIFADPPYNLQLQGDLWRPNMTKVDAVDDDWDKFNSFEQYDEFTRQWLTAARRVLKDTGTIWVIGSYHNIYRVGSIMQDLGYWFLNDVVWIKTNPMPNFRAVRFTNAHETLIWASKAHGTRYTFNHYAMKAFNDGKQGRSDWTLPITPRTERLMVNGKKAHSTQKPEALLHRVIMASTNPGDVVLDPFFGSGTTGAVAKKLHRRWIGIEMEQRYIHHAKRRIDAVVPLPDYQTFDSRDVERRNRRRQRIPFMSLLTHGLVVPGQLLFFDKSDRYATIMPDGKLMSDDGFVGSIHQAARHIAGAPCNGWTHWYYYTPGGMYIIDRLRNILRQQK